MYLLSLGVKGLRGALFSLAIWRNELTLHARQPLEGRAALLWYSPHRFKQGAVNPRKLGDKGKYDSLAPRHTYNSTGWSTKSWWGGGGNDNYTLDG